MKTVKIFKRSIPLWIVVVTLLTITGIAAAVFLNILAGDVQMQARTGPVGVFRFIECRIEAGAGTMDSAELVDHSLTAAASGLDDTSQIYCAVGYTADAGGVSQTLTVQLPDPLPDAISEVSMTNGTGTVFSPGLEKVIYMIIHLENLTPSELVDDFQFEYQFSE